MLVCILRDLCTLLYVHILIPPFSSSVIFQICSSCAEYSRHLLLFHFRPPVKIRWQVTVILFLRINGTSVVYVYDSVSCTLLFKRKQAQRICINNSRYCVEQQRRRRRRWRRKNSTRKSRPWEFKLSQIFQP